MMLFYITAKRKLQNYLRLVDISHLVSRMRSHHRHPVVAFSQEHTQRIQFALETDDQVTGQIQTRMLYSYDIHTIHIIPVQLEINPAQHIHIQGLAQHVWFLLPSIQLTNMLGNTLY